MTTNSRQEEEQLAIGKELYLYLLLTSADWPRDSCKTDDKNYQLADRAGGRG